MKYILHAVFTFFILLAVGLIAGFLYLYSYEGRILKHVTIAGVAIGGLVPEEASKKIQEKINVLEQKGFHYILENGQQISVNPLNFSSDIDLSYDMLDIDIQNSVEKAYLVGRRENFIESLYDLFQSSDIRLQYDFDKEVWMNVMKKNLESYQSQAKNPWIEWKDDATYILHDASDGVQYDIDRAWNETQQRVETLSNEDIALIANIQKSDFTLAGVQGTQIDELVKVASESVLNRKRDYRLILKNKEWKFAGPIVLKWLTLDFHTEEKKFSLKVDEERFGKDLEKIAQEIFVPAQDARLQIENGKVLEFVGSHDGVSLDVAASAELASQGIFEETFSSELAIKEEKSKVSLSEVNNLGLTEIIGTGHSNFKGSPANRIHNIKTGAKSVHGTLIAPAQEFSLIQTLGDIDSAQSGYLPELVIKGNKTQKEFGGGLCQVGTTMFRAALSSGLNITERRNHSYSVSYYLENGLPGVDATIYSPNPDFKFVNDTKNYILIQTRVEGYDLYFDFWGTKDGRKAERTVPKVWGWQDPGPTVYIDTEELKPGEKKCTEVAHKGVKASFDYTVTFIDGTITTKTFSSNYKPWQAVCLVGKDPSLTPPPAETPPVLESDENNDRTGIIEQLLQTSDTPVTQ